MARIWDGKRETEWWKPNEALRQGSQNWNTQQWKDYAATPINSRFSSYTREGQFFDTDPRSSSNFSAWGGGQLSKSDISNANWAQQQEAVKSLQGATDEAKAENLRRYEEILVGYQGRSETATAGYDKLLASMTGLGDAEKEALRHSYDVSGSRQQQSLVNSGLASTTIRPAVQAGNTSAMNRALSLLNERLQRERVGVEGQRIGAEAGYTGDTLGFQERREDEYPDVASYLQLMQQFGTA